MTSGESQAACACDVLVVEDDFDIRDLLADVLRDDGYRVSCAANGKEALALLAMGKPRLVLLDLMMPLVNGWQVLDAIRGDPVLHDLPVIVMTAHGQAADKADLLVRKPFQLEEILAWVARWLGPGQGRHTSSSEGRAVLAALPR